MSPVGKIPTKAPYPGSADRPWNEIPLGLGAGGEIVWDVAKSPHALVAGKSGGGKLLRLALPNLTLNKGWITVGELEVGDTVFDDQGQPATVTHLNPIVTPEKAYKVVFSDGEEVIVDPEHLWFTETLASRASAAQQRMKAKRGDVRADMMLFSQEEVDKIQAVIDTTSNEEVISIPEAAKLIERSEGSKYLYTIAKIVGPGEEIHTTEHVEYNAQIVKQKQNLMHYNAAEFIEVFNNRPIPRTAEFPLKTNEIDKLRQLRYEVRDSDTLSAKSIFEYIGIGGSDVAKRWIRANYNGSVDALVEASESIKGQGLPDQILSFEKEYINSYDFAAVMGKDSKDPKTRQLFLNLGVKITDKFKEPVELELVFSEKSFTRKKAPYFAFPKKRFLEQVLAHAETPINDQRHKMLKGTVKTTQEIKDTLAVRGKTNHSIELVKPLQFPERNLPIAPYALGAWLGDGYSSTGQICGEDHEVKEEIIKLGYALTKEQKPSREYTSETYRIWTFEGLKESLREEGLLLKPGYFVNNHGSPKRIPEEFLFGSEFQRRELLAGLMDTDGTVNKGKGTVSFSTVIPRLRDDFVALVRSLGYQPFTRVKKHKKQDGSQGKDSYEVTFAPKPEDNIFRIARKNASHAKYYKGGNKESVSNRRFIVDVVEVVPEPMRCIKVDSASSLFVVGEGLIPTHNSVAQRNIVFHCIQHSDKWCFLGADPKKVELKPYAKYKNTVLGIATTLEDMVEVIRYAKEQMMSRYEAMEELEVNHFGDLPDPPRAIMLMVDEAYMLMAPEGNKTDQGKENDQLHGEASILIGEIARLGRAAGVHLVLAMQRPDAVVLKGEIKNNLEVRIAAGRLDSTPSAMVLDSGLATRVPSNIKGRGVASMNGDQQIYQGYFASQDWINDWLWDHPEKEPEVYEWMRKTRGVDVAEEVAGVLDDLSVLNDFDTHVDGDDEPVDGFDSTLGNDDDGDYSVPDAAPDAVVDFSRIDDSEDFAAEPAPKKGLFRGKGKVSVKKDSGKVQSDATASEPAPVVTPVTEPEPVVEAELVVEAPEDVPERVVLVETTRPATPVRKPAPVAEAKTSVPAPSSPVKENTVVNNSYLYKEDSVESEEDQILQEMLSMFDSVEEREKAPDTPPAPAVRSERPAANNEAGTGVKPARTLPTAPQGRLPGARPLPKRPVAGGNGNPGGPGLPPRK